MPDDDAAVAAAEAEIWKAITAEWDCQDGAPTSHDRYLLPGGDVAVLRYDTWDHRARRSEGAPRGAGAADIRAVVDRFPAAIAEEAIRRGTEHGVPYGPASHCLVWRVRPRVQKVGPEWHLYARFAFVPRNGRLIGPSHFPPAVADLEVSTPLVSEAGGERRSDVLPGGAWGGTEVWDGPKPREDGDADAG